MAKYTDWLTPEGLIRIEGWARDGLTKEEIAANIGICRDTLNEWEKKHSDISDALKKGREVADRCVENALYKRAVGYTVQEITKERTLDGQLVVTKEVTKEIAPDTTAQILWLKNRKPGQWRDKRDMTIEGKIENPFQGLTTQELKKLAGDG